MRDRWILGVLAGTIFRMPPALHGESPAEVEKIVSRLDTEYQTAVKSNDAATMDRILADDFVLVTGRTTEGKTSDRKLWFSDTYVKTPKGWKYVFGQASLALPQGP